VTVAGTPGFQLPTGTLHTHGPEPLFSMLFVRHHACVGLLADDRTRTKERSKPESPQHPLCLSFGLGWTASA